jgi:hypothetical protein
MEAIDPSLQQASAQLCDAIKEVLRLEEEGDAEGLAKAQEHLDNLITTPNYLFNKPPTTQGIFKPQLT